MSKKFLFVGNSSYLNRGCEAIVRGSVEILRHSFGDCKFTNANFDMDRPAYKPVENDLDIIHKPISLLTRWSPGWVVGQVVKRFAPDRIGQFYFGSMADHIQNSDAVLSIGGDNYSLDYGLPYHYINLDNYVRKFNKPLIIWGASVGPFDKAPEFAPTMLRHLREDVTAIFVREQASLDYLGRNGVIDNVHLMADPAFLMKPQPVGTEALGFELPDNAIGINISPMMCKYVADNSRATLVEIARETISELVRQTGRDMILIPHVTSAHTDDYSLLKEIYDKLTPELQKRAFLMGNNFNAAQTKWVISKLACLIAARTHATIAAFSTCVPTVSLAYSVKAYGINHKLFGHTNYVVRPEDFKAEKIVETTQMVLNKSGLIEQQLRTNLERETASALAAGMKLRDIIGRWV